MFPANIWIKTKGPAEWPDRISHAFPVTIQVILDHFEPLERRTIWISSPDCLVDTALLQA